jgi:DMSO/TMAO reductase YedYZ molybdopterin-dependent catalytic subunit
MNDLVIPIEKGFPFQLVAESKWGYKWIKWVNQIEISDNTGYLGFWESRGYSNNATVPGS